MRYSNRHHLLVDAPGIDHWDFATEGMAASTVSRVRGENAPRLQRTFEIVNRYVLAFFNAYVKEDAAEAAFLRRAPSANGAPEGLATIRELPGIRPAPTLEAFEQLLATRGAAAGLEEFEAARRRDPDAPLFTEGRLNTLGYRLLNREKPAEAIAVFRTIVQMFPASTNAWDSLSEALERHGSRTEALDTTLKALAALEAEALSPARRQQLETALRERLARLQR
jgi:tetratricopeptide (TPR) repeat protein